MKISKVNIQNKLAMFSDHWNPRIIGSLNNQYIKLAKLKGEFVWHKHDEEDEMFYVVSGSLIIEFRDGQVELNPGEFVIVPRGVEHKPVAHHEVEVMLFEPNTTLNTGDATDARTRDKLEVL